MYFREKRKSGTDPADDAVEANPFTEDLSSGEYILCIDEETGEVSALYDPLEAYHKELCAVGL